MICTNKEKITVMKTKFLIFVTMVVAIMSVFALTAGAKEAYLEPIPDELSFDNDPSEYFIVFDGKEYFENNGATISRFNTAKMDAELERLGVSKSEIGTKYLTKFIFPQYMGDEGSETLVTYVNLNSLKLDQTYFWNRVGYISVAPTVTKLHDMNQSVSQLRCIDFGEGSQLTAIPGYLCNGAGRLKSVKNFPRYLPDGIGTYAFNRAKYAFSGELYINTTSVGESAFNNAFTYVTGLTFGELFTSAKQQSFSIRENETGLGAPRLEYIEFECDVTKISLREIGNDKGSFVFAAGSGNQRSSFTNLKCVILSNEANANIVEGTTVLTSLNANLLLNEDPTKVVVYKAHNIDPTTTQITYESILKDGVKSALCGRCAKAQSTSVAPIFTAKGYSVSNDGTGIAGGYFINKEALVEWKQYGGKDVTFGIMLLNPKYLAQGSFINESGVVNSTQGALNVEMTSAEYSSFDFMISNFTLEQATLEIVIAGYVVVDGKYEFLQADYSLSKTPAVSSVTRSDASLYTVTMASIKQNNNLTYLPEYTVQTKEEE